MVVSFRVRALRTAWREFRKRICEFVIYGRISVPTDSWSQKTTPASFAAETRIASRHMIAQGRFVDVVVDGDLDGALRRSEPRLPADTLGLRLLPPLLLLAPARLAVLRVLMRLDRRGECLAAGGATTGSTSIGTLPSKVSHASRTASPAVARRAGSATSSRCMKAINKSSCEQKKGEREG
jgi:hypothetical protein